MPRHAALLRAVNLGRSRRIAMADLRRALSDAGHPEAATLLQSGNVVLESDRPPAELRPTLEQLIERRFGFAVDVILRSRDELARVVARNPLGDVATDGSRYLVAFLADPPATPPDAVLRGLDLGDDRYAVDGTELYLWCPAGMSRSPVMKALAKARGGPPATVRNWNTVGKLLTMMG